MKKFAEIAVEAPLDACLVYSIPGHLSSDVERGSRVLVPLGRRVVAGYVVAVRAEAPEEVKGIKPVMDVLDQSPIFDAQRLRFYRWLSSYYSCSLGVALSLACPAGAAVKGSRVLRPAPASKDARAKEDGLAGEILAQLRSSGRGVSTAELARRFKGRAVNNAVNRLLRLGLATEETVIKRGAGPKTETLAAATGPRSAEHAALLARAPAQARLYETLSERGESSLSALKAELGPVSAPLRGLVKKGLATTRQAAVARDPLVDIRARTERFEPNAEQRSAIGAILKGVGSRTYSPFLLYGVTGSGKTLVYLKVIEEVVKSGKRAVFLAPEIALTSGPAAYLKARFGRRVGLCHSALSEGERMDEWRRMLAGEVDVVVGARSALFSPLKDLGLIIVDEEHETSYKQEEGVRYNARDSALMLASILGITVVLGSATPSVESFYNAHNHKLTPLRLKERVMERSLPEVEVVDMRGAEDKGAVLSKRLVSLMSETLENKGQVLLFLNRRGFSSFIICGECGRAFTCPNCSVSLTMHKRARTLRCHYCDLAQELPSECPECRGTNLVTPRAGTEKVEEEVRALFPEARLGRMDRDTTRTRGSATRIMEAVEQGRVDILIGTQMASKGHDFPGITLVGVISADTGLNIPDFRSAERTFQLITQAAGRAGRGETPGRVVVQTLNPSHFCIKTALYHDYDAFYAEETELRKEVGYPPFTRLCALRIEGKSEARVARAARVLAGIADRARAGRARIEVLGPAPALITRIRGRHRWQMLVKAAPGKRTHQKGAGDGAVKALHAFVREIRAGFEEKKPPGVNLVVDMDPITTV